MPKEEVPFAQLNAYLPQGSFDDVVHYCVTNMPGAVPYTSTLALTNVTLPYVLKIAALGWLKACELNKDLKKGLNIVNGDIVHEGIPRP